MGWLQRKAITASLRSDIRQIGTLDSATQLSIKTQFTLFIPHADAALQEGRAEDLLREWTAKRQSLVAGGFSSEWALAALKESLLMAYVLDNRDPKTATAIRELLAEFAL
jgi:hypothetical protein